LNYDTETRHFSVTEFAQLLEKGSVALSNSPSWAISANFHSEATVSSNLLVPERSTTKCPQEEVEEEKEEGEKAEEENAVEQKAEVEKIEVEVEEEKEEGKAGAEKDEEAVGDWILVSEETFPLSLRHRRRGAREVREIV
jgi:hypothetical protein